MFVDAHAHLEYPDFLPDLDSVISRAKEAGISAIITSGTDIPSSERVITLAEKYDIVYASVGFHPHEAENAKPGDVKQLENMLSHPKVVALGEIGLDFHYNLSSKDAQLGLFADLLAMAATKKKSVVIHARGAETDALKAVQHAAIEKALFHCFTGEAEVGRAIQQAGFIIGVTGIVTFKNPSNAVLVSSLDPLRLVTETDAPFLAPVPHRGSRNESAHIPLIFNKLASLFSSLSSEKLMEQIQANIRELFFPIAVK